MLAIRSGSLKRQQTLRAPAARRPHLQPASWARCQSSGSSRFIRAPSWAARHGPSVTRSQAFGAAVRYELNVRASLRFTVQRTIAGRVVGGRCEPRSHGRRKGRRCDRHVDVGRFNVTGQPGDNGFRFSARLNGSSLTPGNGTRPTAALRPATAGTVAPKPQPSGSFNESQRRSSARRRRDATVRLSQPMR